MDDINAAPITRISWLVEHLRDRYSRLRLNPAPDIEPSGIRTFFNGVHVVEKCIIAKDPQLDMFLGMLVTTAWSSVEGLCHEDFASDDEKIRSMALWRKAFFQASLELKGVDGYCKAMDIANASVVNTWIAGVMGVSSF